MKSSILRPKIIYKLKNSYNFANHNKNTTNLLTFTPICVYISNNKLQTGTAKQQEISMKYSISLIFFAFCILMGAPSANSAEQFIYKWKDKEGMVHYTERRPDPGIPFEKVRRQADKNSKQNSTPEPAKNEQTQDSTYGNWRQENCKRAIENLDILESSSQIATTDEKGEKRMMTEEEKQANIEKMKKQRDKYCEEKKSD